MNRRLVLLLVVLSAAPLTFAQTLGEFEIGVRPYILGAGGEPANDIVGTGVLGRYYLSDTWSIAAAVEVAEYDFERPWLTVGIEQDTSGGVIDAPTSTTTFIVWAEREFGHSAATRWYVGFGAG